MKRPPALQDIVRDGVYKLTDFDTCELIGSTVTCDADKDQMGARVATTGDGDYTVLMEMVFFWDL